MQVGGAEAKRRREKKFLKTPNDPRRDKTINVENGEKTKKERKSLITFLISSQGARASAREGSSWNYY